MEVSGADGIDGVSGIVPCFKSDAGIVLVVKVTDHLSERSANEDCLSSWSFRASSLRASKVKVQLAHLALKHEEERQQEATQEKMRQLEMAKAKLEALEASSVSSRSVKVNKASNTAVPRRKISPCLGSEEVGICVVPDCTKNNKLDYPNYSRHSPSHAPMNMTQEGVNPGLSIHFASVLIP